MKRSNCIDNQLPKRRQCDGTASMHSVQLFRWLCDFLWIFDFSSTFWLHRLFDLIDFLTFLWHFDFYFDFSLAFLTFHWLCVFFADFLTFLTFWLFLTLWLFLDFFVTFLGVYTDFSKLGPLAWTTLGSLHSPQKFSWAKISEKNSTLLYERPTHSRTHGRMHLRASLTLQTWSGTAAATGAFSSLGVVGVRGYTTAQGRRKWGAESLIVTFT